MTVLLTLAVHSLDSLLESGKVDLMDVPAIASERLGLRGLMIDAAHLSGWEMKQYDQFRDRGDKSNCPCLLVRDSTPMDLSGDGSAAEERIDRLAAAAGRLGCSSITISPVIEAGDQSVQAAVGTLQRSMHRIDRLELNLLLEPSEGITLDPDQHIELIKQIGGFRIGALPTFGCAGETGDGSAVLRKLAPYAGGVVADYPTGRGKKAVKAGDGLRAVVEVGYAHTISIDYVGKGDPIREVAKVRDEMVAVIESE